MKHTSWEEVGWRFYAILSIAPLIVSVWGLFEGFCAILDGMLKLGLLVIAGGAVGSLLSYRLIRRSVEIYKRERE